jgi:receptor expression-enhancing protein 5/6
MEHINRVVDTLSEQTKNLPVLKEIAQKTGLSTGHVALGGIVFLIGFMLLGIGADLITDLIGMFYPMYMSFKALESKGGDDDKLWLTYWVIYAIYKVLDDWSSLLFFWVPFYYPIKLAFLIFLFAPQTKGAIKLYDSVIRPFMVKHQKDIEAGITKIGEAASIASQAAKEEALRRGSDYVVKGGLNH